MKNVSKYISTMYAPSRRILTLGLFIFLLSLLAFALSLHSELAAGSIGLIHIYPAMLEKVIFPLPILLAATLLTDLNERKRTEK